MLVELLASDASRHVRFLAQSRHHDRPEIPALRLKSRCGSAAERHPALSDQVFQAVRC
jgi:hypothetical protein